jgi:hypothetical protein
VDPHSAPAAADGEDVGSRSGSDGAETAEDAAGPASPDPPAAVAEEDPATETQQHQEPLPDEQPPASPVVPADPLRARSVTFESPPSSARRASLAVPLGAEPQVRARRASMTAAVGPPPALDPAPRPVVVRHSSVRSLYWRGCGLTVRRADADARWRCGAPRDPSTAAAALCSVDGCAPPAAVCAARRPPAVANSHRARIAADTDCGRHHGGHGRTVARTAGPRVARQPVVGSGLARARPKPRLARIRRLSQRLCSGAMVSLV